MTSAFCANAQNVDKTITLNEVTVKASKVVNKADGMIIYPTMYRSRLRTMVTAFLRNSHLPIFVLTTSAILLLLLITEVAFNFE